MGLCLYYFCQRISISSKLSSSKTTTTNWCRLSEHIRLINYRKKQDKSWVRIILTKINRVIPHISINWLSSETHYLTPYIKVSTMSLESLLSLRIIPKRSLKGKPCKWKHTLIFSDFSQCTSLFLRFQATERGLNHIGSYQA